MATRLSLPFKGPNKVSISGPIPSNGPRNGYCPYQNHCVPRHVNNSIIWRLDLMILMRANPLLRLLEGVGPENRDFFWAMKWQEAKRAIWVQKSHFFYLILSLLGFSDIVLKFYAAHPVSNIFLVCHLGPKKSFGPL
jgi:hypothetical protein